MGARLTDTELAQISARRQYLVERDIEDVLTDDEALELLLCEQWVDEHFEQYYHWTVAQMRTGCVHQATAILVAEGVW